MLRSVASVLLLLLRATAADAHTVGISRGEYRADGAVVHADVILARKELLAALPDVDADGDGELSAAEVTSGRDALSAWLRRGVVVQLASGACEGQLDKAALTEQDGVELIGVYRCPGPADAFSV